MALGAGIRAAVREHWMLMAAALAAAASMLAVPPDAAYGGYFDWRTIGCLFCVLAVANAFRRMGAIDRIARAAVGCFGQPRTLVLVLVVVTGLLSMAFTNDVALIVMLPFSAAALVEAKCARLVPAAFALQALAANLWGMIAPFGSPQNLYLYTYYSIGFGEFLETMLLPFAVAAAGILVAVWCLTGKRAAKSCSQPMPGEPRERPFVAPLSRRRLGLYGALFALTLLAVFRVVPVFAAVAVVALALAAFDRRALAEVDYGLLATFLCFFVFAGNIARIPALEQLLVPLMGEWGLLVSAGASQIISNVPAAVLLSHFTGDWASLLVGVNIGGAGTFIGSLASLIAIRYFAAARRIFPDLRVVRDGSMGRFLLLFGVLNMGFFAGLAAVCQLWMG